MCAKMPLLGVLALQIWRSQAEGAGEARADVCWQEEMMSCTNSIYGKLLISSVTGEYPMESNCWRMGGVYLLKNKEGNSRAPAKERALVGKKKKDTIDENKNHTKSVSLQKTESNMARHEISFNCHGT